MPGNLQMHYSRPARYSDAGPLVVAFEEPAIVPGWSTLAAQLLVPNYIALRYYSCPLEQVVVERSVGAEHKDSAAEIADTGVAGIQLNDSDSCFVSWRQYRTDWCLTLDKD